jgi:hypothetical protein
LERCGKKLSWTDWGWCSYQVPKRNVCT